MIDPVNPGPAGTSGPAGTVGNPLAPGAMDALSQYGTALIAQAMATTSGAIQTFIGQAVGTIKDSLAKISGAVAANYNTAETTAQLSSAAAQTATRTALQAITVAAQTGKTADQGAKPGQYTWEIWSVKSLTGWGRGIVEPRSAGYSSGPDFCFRGGSDDFFDAVNMSKELGPLPYNACPSPGGFAAVPIGSAIKPPECALYQVWESADSKGQPICTIQCVGQPGPAGAFPFGPEQDLQGAQALVVVICGSGSGTHTGTTALSYYGGCVSGKPVTWLSTDPAPEGVTGQVGPFADVTVALTAAGACGGKGMGNGMQTGTGGPCCDPATGEVKLPKCIYIDLCDWPTFYDNMWRAIKKGLCEFAKDPTCTCAFQDSTRYMFEDCDERFKPAADNFAGSLGAVLAGNTVDGVADIAAGLASDLGSSVVDTGSDPWPSR